MNWFTKTWRWLDQKKTVIGGAMVWSSTFVPPHTIGYAILFYGGSLLGGSGVVHKIVKNDLGSLPSGVQSVQKVAQGVSANAMKLIKRNK
jgi:hypothetical protein